MRRTPFVYNNLFAVSFPRSVDFHRKSLQEEVILDYFYCHCNNETKTDKIQLEINIFNFLFRLSFWIKITNYHTFSCKAK